MEWQDPFLVTCKWAIKWWPAKALPLIDGLYVGGLGADGGTVPLASELLKRADLEDPSWSL